MFLSSKSRPCRRALPRIAIALGVVASTWLAAGCSTGGRANAFSASVGPSGIAVSRELGSATFADHLFECRRHRSDDACIRYGIHVAAAAGTACHDGLQSGHAGYAFCTLCVRTPPNDDRHWSSCMSLAHAMARPSSSGFAMERAFDPSRPDVPPGATQDPAGSPQNLALPPLAPDAMKKAKRTQTNKATVASTTAIKPVTARRSALQPTSSGN